ncbi:MAG TPA: hypothetical protein VHY37_06230 [Tepidisphaeraceae bacterium]|nr:hypothetical protein [Tepidisphaeraceae bacterium]
MTTQQMLALVTERGPGNWQYSHGENYFVANVHYDHGRLCPCEVDGKELSEKEFIDQYANCDWHLIPPPMKEMTTDEVICSGNNGIRFFVKIRRLARDFEVARILGAEAKMESGAIIDRGRFNREFPDARWLGPIPIPED